ncbi:hypothetical protein GGS23DRAFT_598031 [Durotheca rogersii]|uniref:uncharacterized protein n=1 Tax=Durotheca rogersii TaxID=419775 RepID=UPI00221F2677|nr:uncharacterized protein GGS23DRAFT_598031 [Durotheca rogersii]KAI5862014.1 hypothetical protein GGS23DRAFT_598031 [Durotheca rogersii]
MASSTVVFISGAGRGIGRSLAEAYLSRPNHTVVGSVRDPTSANAQEIKAFPAAEGSRFLLVKIESSSFSDPAAAVKEAEAAGVDHIDVLIANAGGAGGSISPLDKVTPQDVTDVFNINALGPLALYQAAKPLLDKSKAPKFLGISSAVGSIGNMENFRAHVAPAYGIAKAGLNWISVAAHSGNKEYISFVVHPGLVQTDGGNRAAKGMGLPQAPHTKKQSTDAILALLDNATREKTSGKFFDAIAGTEIPW